jgi:hypothetical protein
VAGKGYFMDYRRWSRFVVADVIAAATFGVLAVDNRNNASGQVAPPSWLTRSFDRERSGANLQETTLTQASVSQGDFGARWYAAVDDQVFAQPLYAYQVPMPTGGSKNIVIVATVSNTVYGIDADSGAVLWTTCYSDASGFCVGGSNPGEFCNPATACNGGTCNFPTRQCTFTLGAGRPPRGSWVSHLGNSDGPCGTTPDHCGCGNQSNSNGIANLDGNLGIVGTPVIDTSTNSFGAPILYVVTHTYEGCGGDGPPCYYPFLHYRLRALNVATGAELPGGHSAIIEETAGPTQGGGTRHFGDMENQRTALAVYGGQVAFAFGSYCDNSAGGGSSTLPGGYAGFFYTFWNMNAGASAMKEAAHWHTNTDYTGAGIWPGRPREEHADALW